MEASSARKQGRKSGLWIGLLGLAVVAFLARDAVFESSASAWFVRTVASTSDSFKESYAIKALIEPTDLKLYRALLPERLDLPKHPLLQVVMVHQVDVGPWPLTPYKEGAVSLRGAYRGEEGWYLPALPVSTWVACFAGRTMGYPKYVADSVVVDQKDGRWRTEIVHEGASRLRMSFVPGAWDEPPVWTREGWPTEGPTFNLEPTGIGPEIRAVESAHRLKPRYEETPGMATIEIGKDEPWARLFPPGAVTVQATLVHYKGGRKLVVRE